MSKEAQKKESTKIERFTVVENGQEVVNTSEKSAALESVKALQKEHKPLIVLLDNLRKTSMQYTKSINQKNYRIGAGNFENDTVKKTTSEVIETVE